MPNQPTYGDLRSQEELVALIVAAQARRDGDVKLIAKEAMRELLRDEEGQLLMGKVAQDAAERALGTMLVKLGVDPSVQGLIEFSQALQQLERWRRIINSGWTKFLAVAIGLLAASGITAVINFFKGP